MRLVKDKTTAGTAAAIGRRLPRPTQLQAAVLLVPMLLFCVLAVWTWLSSERNARERAARAAEIAAEHALRVLEGQQSIVEAALAHIGDRKPEEIARDRSVHEFLRRLSQSTDVTDAISLIDGATGRVISDSTLFPALEDVQSEREYVRAFAGGPQRTYVSRTLLTYPYGDPGFTVSRANARSGIIAVARPRLEDFLAFFEALHESKHDEVMLIRDDGAVLARTPRKQNPVGIELPADYAERLKHHEAPGRMRSRSPIDNAKRIVTFKPVGQFPIAASYGIDTARVHGMWLNQIAPLGILSLFGSGLLLTLAARAQRAESAADAARTETATQRALREAEERFRRVFENAATGIALTGWDGRFQESNAAYCTLLGYTQEELKKMSFDELVHPEDRAANLALVARLKVGEIPYFMTENRYVRRSGTAVWVRKYTSMLTDAAGRSVQILSLVTDITERHAAEERLRASEERLRLANEAAGIGTFEVDAAKGEVRYSPELAQMLGFPGVLSARLEQALARVHRDDQARVRALFTAAHAPSSDGALRMEFRYVRPGGAVRWMTWNGKVEFSGTRPVRIVGACVDTTERKNAEESLRASEMRLRTIVDTAEDAILVVDASGTIESANPATERMFGRSLDRLVGQNVSILTPAPDPASQDRTMRSYFETGVRKNMGTGSEVTAARSDGTEFPAEISVVEWQAGGKRHFTGIMRDITERKRDELRIQHLLSELNHRAKNLLGVVQAIAMQTAATSPESFVERFSERLSGLAASQDLLVESQWRGIDLEALARAQLAHFASLIGTRIVLDGASARINAAAAQTLGLALHELATNAGKYGALSDAAGRIAISWQISDEQLAEQRFRLSWTETCGPPVRPPTRRGFGTTVVEAMPQMSLDGKVVLDYRPEGLSWSLDCPAEHVLDPIATRHASPKLH